MSRWRDGRARLTVGSEPAGAEGVGHPPQDGGQVRVVGLELDGLLGQAIAAQACGDAAVLEARGRRVLRVHLDGPAAVGLERLAARIEAVA